MARKVLPSEAQALATSEMLLRFAAENVPDLPRATVATICHALDAQADGTWDEQIATDFWCAFNALCAVLKPATVDTLSTNLVAVPPPRWLAWAGNAKPVSVSRRTATRYLALLIVLLLISVVLGFLVSTTLGLSKDAEQLAVQGDELSLKLTAAADALEAELDGKPFAEAPDAQRPAIAAIQAQLQQQNHVLDQMLQKSVMMTRLMRFGLGGATIEPGNLADARNIADVRQAVRDYQFNRREVASDRLSAQITMGVLTATVLPIVLGIMGACAYVVRLISDQIKDTTFSATSPIRHLVRVALGGLSGVVIGFSGVVTDMGLSSAALAFIAGYAVEPVFSTIDGIAEKFRR